VSHTFRDEQTGIRIFCNSDYSGDATIVLPFPYEEYPKEFQVPARVLIEFSRRAVIAQMLEAHTIDEETDRG
jgi:hypothetical protein